MNNKRKHINDQLTKLYKDNNKWVNIVKKLGATEEDAEDVVSTMYLIIAKMLDKGLDIEYKNDVNYYYIYLTLRTNYFKLYNKKSKRNKVELTDNYIINDDVDYENAEEIIEKVLSKTHFYEEKVYRLISSGEYTITSLSKKTGIKYQSLYRTYNKVIKHLKKELIS